MSEIKKMITIIFQMYTIITILFPAGHGIPWRSGEARGRLQPTGLPVSDPQVGPRRTPRVWLEITPPVQNERTPPLLLDSPSFFCARGSESTYFAVRPRAAAVTSLKLFYRLVADRHTRLLSIKS